MTLGLEEKKPEMGGTQVRKNAAIMAGGVFCRGLGVTEEL